MPKSDSVPLVLGAGEFILWNDAELVAFDRTAACVAYIRRNFHPRAKALHLRRRGTEVLIYSLDRELLRWVDAQVARFWTEAD